MLSWRFRTCFRIRISKRRKRERRISVLNQSCQYSQSLSAVFHDFVCFFPHVCGKDGNTSATAEGVAWHHALMLWVSISSLSLFHLKFYAFLS